MCACVRVYQGHVRVKSHKDTSAVRSGFFSIKSIMALPCPAGQGYQGSKGALVPGAARWFSVQRCVGPWKAAQCRGVHFVPWFLTLTSALAVVAK